MSDGSYPRSRVVLSFLSIRKATWLLSTAVVIGLLVAVVGSAQVATPSASGEAPTVAFWRVFSVAAGALPSLVLMSPLRDVEVAAGHGFHRCQSAALVVGFLISGGAALAGTLLVADVGAASSMQRALMGWFGLALFTGRLLGWRLGWVGPWTAAAVLLYWGYDGAAGQYRWWEFTAQPIDHLPSWTLAGALFVAGLGAFVSTPWRLRQLRGLLVRRDSGAAAGGGSGAGREPERSTGPAVSRTPDGLPRAERGRRLSETVER
jgi:hypothetical protein